MLKTIVLVAHNIFIAKASINGNLKPLRVSLYARALRNYTSTTFKTSQEKSARRRKEKCVICQVVKRIAFIFIIHSAASTKDVTLKNNVANLHTDI